MPLNKNSPAYAHQAQVLSLVILSLLFLPLNTFILLACYVKNVVFPPRMDRQRERAQHISGFKPRNILVTGVGMGKGLALARLFYQAGHRVIGADFEPFAPCSGRGSRSIARFYHLYIPQSGQSGSAPYAETLLQIILREKVDIWVSCSAVSAAVEDGEAKEIIEARSSCRAIQFDTATTRTLHEKDSFTERTAALGLSVPETHSVTDRATIKSVLKSSPDKFFILKTVGVNDAARSNLALLPRPSPEGTDAFLSQLPISTKTPWVMQEFVRGDEFCTHALVIHGRVRAFVACPSSELLMHYRALASDSPLTAAMLEFTETFALKSGRKFTGHLSFDFLVRKQDLRELDYRKIRLYPIECNPRCHTAIVLFSRTPSMVDRYLEVLKNDDEVNNEQLTVANQNDSKTNTKNSVQQHKHKQILFPRNPPKVYWLSHDLVTLAILPILKNIVNNLPKSLKSSIITKLFSQPSSSSPSNEATTTTSYDAADENINPSQSLAVFLEHLLRWKEGTFEIWDPLPWWLLNHVYWPLEVLSAAVWTGKRFSRFNVSTTKKFEC